MNTPFTPRFSRRPSSRSFAARAGQTRRPLLRIQRIHELIRLRRYPNCTTLAREIEVTAKTIQRDISYMRDELNLPLEYHEERHGYFYTQPVGEFPLLQMSRQELLGLFLARKALEPIRGTRLERVLSESFSKLADSCPGEVSFHWRELDDAFSMKTAGVIKADLDLFNDLMDAVLKWREVTFAYRKLKARRPEQRHVQPYHVGQIENGWYLFGHDLARDEVRTFALQRMKGLEVLKTTFRRPAGFSMRQHLSGSFGVWAYAGDTRREHPVRLRFEGYAARVVAEREWHPSQQIMPCDEDDEVIEMRLRVAGLEELTRWVLGWGSKVTVLEPAELRERIREEVRLMGTR